MASRKTSDFVDLKPNLALKSNNHQFFSNPTCPPWRPGAQFHVCPDYTLSSLTLKRLPRRRAKNQRGNYKLHGELWLNIYCVWINTWKRATKNNEINSKVTKPLWKQRNRFGTIIKIMWEEQLVDPLIYYILVIFSITLMGHFKHNTPKQHSHTIKRYLFTIQNDMDHLSTSAGVWCAAPHLHVKIYNICLNFRISLETQYSKRNSFCIFCQNDENAIESGFFP